MIQLFREMVIPSLQFCRVSSLISKEGFLEKLTKIISLNVMAKRQARGKVAIRGKKGTENVFAAKKKEFWLASLFADHT